MMDYFYPNEEEMQTNHFKKLDVKFNKEIDMVNIVLQDEKDGKKLSIWIPAGPFFDETNKMAIRRAT